jgi:AhpC/TSA family/Thiol:disulfide interchange protein DsbD, N-terminal
LQDAKDRFEKQGIKLAAISYDSPAILKDFADRHKIDFPLLGDPQSDVLRSFHVLNMEAKGMAKGMAHPGFLYIDKDGLIRDKFFESNELDRFTPNNVISRLFPELINQVGPSVKSPHLRLRLAQSDRVVAPGNRVTLVAEVDLAQGVHVYAPEVQGYKPIHLDIAASPEFALNPAVYPKPKVLYLEAIQEHVPVYEGTFRITQDVTLSTAQDFVRSLGEGKVIAIGGKLLYQACDERTCFLPTSVPITWQLKVLPLDRQRSPADLQHK